MYQSVPLNKPNLSNFFSLFFKDPGIISKATCLLTLIALSVFIGLPNKALMLSGFISYSSIVFLLCLSDRWTQRFWEHSTPHGLSHGARLCGHWAGELRCQHQPAQPLRQHATASGCRLLQRGAVSRAAHQQWCWRQHAGEELVLNKWIDNNKIIRNG